MEEEEALRNAGSNKKKGKSAKHARSSSNQPNEKDGESFKNIVRDFNKARIHVDPRDFSVEPPILC
jgi:hypothetical protein